MSSRLPVVLALILGLAFVPATHAAAPAVAQTEINHLLESVAASGCQFFRNGSWYEAKKAEAHLRYKYEMLAAGHQINTAEDFIEKAASKSSLSGRPYAIRCNGGVPVATNQWLREMLTLYRSYGTGGAPRSMRGALG